MVLFPSEEWCHALADLLNHSPEHLQDAGDYVGTSTWVITADGALTQTVRLYFSFDHGKLIETGVIPAGEPRETDDTTTAPLGTWRKVVEGKLNPVPALVRGQLKLEGRAMHVLRNVKAVHSLFEHVLRIPTEFPE